MTQRAATKVAAAAAVDLIEHCTPREPRKWLQFSIFPCIHPSLLFVFFFFLFIAYFSLFAFHCVRWMLAVNVDGELNLVTLKKFIVQTQRSKRSLFSPHYFLYLIFLSLPVRFSSLSGRHIYAGLVYNSVLVTRAHTTHLIHLPYTSVNRLGKRRRRIRLHEYNCCM